MPLEVDTPDHASIWRFLQTIDKLGLSAALLSETNRRLDALGLNILGVEAMTTAVAARAVRLLRAGEGALSGCIRRPMGRKRPKFLRGRSIRHQGPSLGVSTRSA
jgi:hypothetical protein